MLRTLETCPFFLYFFHTSFRVLRHTFRGLCAECRWTAYSLEFALSKRTSVVTSHTHTHTHTHTHSNIGNNRSQNNHKKHSSESRPMCMGVTNARKEDIVGRSENKDVEYMYSPVFLLCAPHINGTLGYTCWNLLETEIRNTCVVGCSVYFTKKVGSSYIACDMFRMFPIFDPCPTNRLSWLRRFVT